MSLASKSRATIRLTLKKLLSQERRTELKRMQGNMRKRMAPVLTMVHGSFNTKELIDELARRTRPATSCRQ